MDSTTKVSTTKTPDLTTKVLNELQVGNLVKLVYIQLWMDFFGPGLVEDVDIEFVEHGDIFQPLLVSLNMFKPDGMGKVFPLDDVFLINISCFTHPRKKKIISRVSKQPSQLNFLVSRFTGVLLKGSVFRKADQIHFGAFERRHYLQGKMHLASLTSFKDLFRWRTSGIQGAQDIDVHFKESR